MLNCSQRDPDMFWSIRWGAGDPGSPERRLLSRSATWELDEHSRVGPANLCASHGSLFIFARHFSGIERAAIEALETIGDKEPW